MRLHRPSDKNVRVKHFPQRVDSFDAGVQLGHGAQPQDAHYGASEVLRISQEAMQKRQAHITDGVHGKPPGG
eukprot:scaffold1220_cov259-Pinguiococcus_pyrenoidosus.AAC.66